MTSPIPECKDELKVSSFFLSRGLFSSSKFELPICEFRANHSDCWWVLELRSLRLRTIPMIWVLRTFAWSLWDCSNFLFFSSRKVRRDFVRSLGGSSNFLFLNPRIAHSESGGPKNGSHCRLCTCLIWISGIYETR